MAADALGPRNVTALALPGPYSSSLSFDLAQKLARNLGIHFHTVDINPLYEAGKKAVDSSFQISEFGLVHENLQARIRGTILMAFANKENSMLLSTSNKCEYATGYSTLYGDMCGGLAPIGDLTKEQVKSLCELYNKEKILIPPEILTRAPSAELRPNQKDQDSLPPYKDLDRSVVNLVEKSGKVKTATDRWLLSRMMKTEFKRWQAPPILKLSARAFGRGRRWPIAHQAKEI